jgi:hypothetical protein
MREKSTNTPITLACKKHFFSAVKTKIVGFYSFRCAEFKNAVCFAISRLVNWQ